MSRVKQGWFMPLTLLGFGLALAGLWGYVTYSESASELPLATSGPRGNALADPELNELVERDARSRIFLPPPASIANSSKAPSPPADIEGGASEKIASERTREITITLAPETTGAEKKERWRSPIAVARDWFRLHKQSLAYAAFHLDEEAVRWRSNLGGATVARTVDGWRQISEGRPESAIESFNRILYREPENLTALAGKAQALMALRRYTEALATYQYYLKLRPEDADAWYTRGVMLSRASRLGEAADHFRTATRLNPNHTKAWYNLAALAQRDGRLAEAREGWETFTRIDPSIASGWYNLGTVYMDFVKPFEAARCFSYVVMIDPTDIDGYVNLAEAFRATGDYDAALSILQQADELAPCDPVVMRVMADAHRAMASLYSESETEHLMAATELDEMARSVETWNRPEQVAVEQDEDAPRD